MGRQLPQKWVFIPCFIHRNREVGGASFAYETFPIHLVLKRGALVVRLFQFSFGA